MNSHASIGVPAVELFDTALYRANRNAAIVGDAAAAASWSNLETPGNHVEIFTTRSGVRGWAAQGRYLTSRFDPVSEAERVVKRIFEENHGRPPGVLAIFGSAGAYVIRAALDAGCPQIHVYEPDADVLVSTLGAADLGEPSTSGRVRFVTNIEQLYFQIDYREGGAPDMAVAICPSYPKAYPEALAAFEIRLKALVHDSAILSRTILSKMDDWFRFAMANFPVFAEHPGVHRLFHAFPKTPAVVVAAGPSLDLNIECLREYRDRVLIVAVGTALKKLEHMGIVPDLAVALESNDIRFQFEGVSFLPEVFGALNLNAFPDLWRLPFRSVFGFTGKPASFSWLTEKVGLAGTEIAVGGSVATSAFSIAALMDCDPVILIGQDLAFSPTGAMHAMGVGAQPGQDVAPEILAALEDDALLARHGFARVEGWHGGRVLTRTNFRNYQMWFEKNAGILTLLGRTGYNCTEGGVHIHGFVHKPLREVLETLPALDFDPRERIGGLGARNIYDHVALVRALDSAVVSLKKLRHRSRLLVREIDAAEKSAKAARGADDVVRRALRRCERTDRDVGPILAELDPLLSPLANRHILHTQVGFDYRGLNDAEQALVNLRQTRALYNGFASAAERLIEALTSLGDRLMDQD